MRKHRGFTLVELLVVIGIIALLISILLPALNKARESAKIVACSSQMRQVALAARAYAADNRDSLPPMPGDNNAQNYMVGSSTAEITTANTITGSGVMGPGGFCPPYARSVFWPYWVNSQTSTTEIDPALTAPKTLIGAGIGRLIARGYMGGPFYKLIQCPAAYVGEEKNEARNYGFNSQFALRAQPGTGTMLPQPWWRKMAGYGRVKGTFSAVNMASGATKTNYGFGARRFALVTDAINFPNVGEQFGVVSHLSKSNYAVNLCFSDGSVQTAYMPKTITRLGANYGRLIDLLAYLELSLEGNGTGATWAAGTYGYCPVLSN